MATTYLQLLNRVLVNLSEPEVSTSATELTEDYNKLIRNYLNHIKEEVEDATNWSSHLKRCTLTYPQSVLRNTVTILDPNTDPVTARATLANQRDYLARISQHVPLCMDITDPTQPAFLDESPLHAMILRQETETEAASEPAFFALDPDADNQRMRVFPAPTSDRNIVVYLFAPDPRWNGDTTDINLNINLPEHAITSIELGTTWYALNERGEELGVNAQFSQTRYTDQLRTAVARDDQTASGSDMDLIPV